MCSLHNNGRENYEKETNFFMVVVLMLASYPISQAKAAKTGITTIDFGKVYKNYDLDGDGKKDSLKVVATYPKGNEHETGYLTIYTNNKKVFSKTIWSVLVCGFGNSWHRRELN